MVEQTGTPPGSVDRFVELGLVIPTDEGKFDEFDLRMVELLRRAEEVDIPADAFVDVAEAVRQVEEAAARIVSKHVPTPLGTEQASVLVNVLGRMQPYLVRRYFESREL